MTGIQLIQEIEAAGGVLTLNGDKISYDVPRTAHALLDGVRGNRAAVLQVLRQRQETAKRQVSAWLEARCTQSRQAWAAEKFLYREFAAWCDQRNLMPCSRDLFRGILAESFERDDNGWLGLCLVVDFAAVTGGH